MNALIQLVDVSKRYADTPALHSTNLSIERGTTTVLIGPSGCGKSTLLRLIIGLVEPDSGTIDFDGSPMTHDKIDLLRLRGPDAEVGLVRSDRFGANWVAAFGL